MAHVVEPPVVRRETSPPLMVAAIDFGSTFSGYACSLTTSPTEIRMNPQWGAAAGIGPSWKTPNWLLLDKDGKLDKFGFEAKEKFGDLDEEERVQYGFYENVKMLLYDSEDLSRETRVTAQNNQQCSLMTLVQFSLNFLKEHLLQQLKKQVDREMNHAHIKWVVTVPAIWDEKAKSFMREAAKQAGLINDDDPSRFLLALEPEAASIHCRTTDLTLPTASNDNGTLPVGTKFLVVDAGGGTLDMTAQEILRDGQMEVLCCANGGPLGGNRVNQKLVEILEEILGVDCVRKHKERSLADYNGVMYTLENRKKVITENDDKTFNVTITQPFAEMYHEVHGASMTESLSGRKLERDGYKFSSGILRVSSRRVLPALTSVTGLIVDAVEEMLNRPELVGVSHIIMVGGFSTCQLLQDAVRQRFGTDYRVVILHDADVAVLKGAVQFGHRPEMIHARRAAKTYVIDGWPPFMEGKHDPKKKITSDDGCDLVRDGAHVLVKKGETVTVNTTHIYRVTPVFANQKRIPIKLFETDKPEPLYTDEEGVKLVARIPVELPGSGMDREIEVRFRFGGTEIDVEGIDLENRKSVKTSVDFLTK